MSYDLAIRVGAKPVDAADANAEYARRMDELEAAFGRSDKPDPAPELIAFAQAARRRYPELDENSGLETPWASSPLEAEIVGDLIYFPLTFSGAEYARDVLAEIADSLGLVCYDPQVEQVLPDSNATPAAEIGSRAAQALATYLDQRDGAPPELAKRRRLFARRSR